MIAICIGTVGVVLYTFFWAWTVDSVEHAKEVNSMDKTKHIRMLFLFGILLNILILLVVGGIFGAIHLHNEKVSKVKTIIAEGYPDAVDFETYGVSPIKGDFKFSGRTYVFEETENIHGKRVLYISEEGKESMDSKIVDLDD